MALSKQQVRRALAATMGDFVTLVTTSAGNAGGSTFVCTDFDSKGTDFNIGWWAVIEADGGGLQGKFAQVKGLVGTSPATFTISPPLGAQIGSGVTIGLYPFRPSMYTVAFNEAVIESYPALHVGSMDDTLTVAANTWEYTLPAGVTPQMVKAVAIEGSGLTDGKPDQYRNDWTFSPDQTELWLGRSNRPVYVLTTDRTIFLFLQDYLTQFSDDTTTSLVADTTAVLELDLGANYYKLFEAYARACLYDQLAARPRYGEKGEVLQVAKQARAEAQRKAAIWAMPEVRAPVWV